MNWILLIISIFSAITQTAIFTKSAATEIDSSYKRYFFSTVNSLAAGAIILIVSLCRQTFIMPSGFTVFWGIMFGIATATTYISNLGALANGPLSYTVLLSNCSMIIPALAGRFFYGESLYLLQVVGIVMLLVSFYFIFNPKKNEELTLKWLLFALTTFVACAAVGSMQKIHQSSDYKNELDMFLVIAFAVSIAISAVFTLVYKKKDNKAASKNNMPKVALLACLSGLFVAFCNIVNLYLSGVLPSAIFFPVLNGAYIIGSGLVSVFMFREKLTPKKIAAFLIGIIAILLIGNIIPLNITL